MRAPLPVLTLTAALALLASATPARAAEPGPDTLPIHVIAIQTPDADDQAEALTKALRNAVRAVPGWSLGEGDYSLEVLSLSLKCPEPPDANCQSRIADQIKADRYVWGIVQKKGAVISGDLYLWQRGRGTAKVPLEYTANLTEASDDALKKIATDAVDQLTGGAPKGSVHVKAGTVSGQVFVDGQPVGALTGGDGTFLVPSGTHKITVKSPGYADAEMSVAVRPTGAPAEVSLTPIAAGDGEPTNWKRWGGVGLIGVGVGFGIGGLVSGLQVSKAQDTLDPILPTRSGDVCSNADGAIKDACDKGKTFQTMQFVFYPLAAVSAGVGAYLVATSGSAKKPAATTGFQINPMVGPQGGFISVAHSF